MSADSLSPSVLAELSEARAYPGDPSAAAGVERLQTHISFLFLTGERVYKFRRDVDLGFLCFASREERNRDCLREVELNRRLAPDLYLGVAPLESGSCGAQVGAIGEELAQQGSLEHCVVMRRLPAGRDALHLLEAGTLSGAQIDRVARAVASFHDRSGLGTPAPFSPAQWVERCCKPVEDCHRHLMAAAERSLIHADAARVARLARARAGELAGAFENRRARGLAVNAHGDMHLEHIWFERDDSAPLIIDCLEFSTALREIDAASEVAFTAMDLRYRGAPELAERYLSVYARKRDDFDLYSVVDYFESYRAVVRAKVAALAAGDSAMDAARRSRAAESADRHLELARRALEPTSAPGQLILVGGPVGTGKSTVAHAVADEIGAVVISTDEVRKRRLGLDATARPERVEVSRIYSEKQKSETYAAVVDRARSVIASGRPAVLDGTFSHRSDRERALALGKELSARCFFLETHCEAPEALRRLAARAARGQDASDAGPERHAPSVAEFESLVHWPAPRRAIIRTDGDDWQAALPDLLAKLSGAER